jgi:beta-glucosidase
MLPWRTDRARRADAHLGIQLRCDFSNGTTYMFITEATQKPIIVSENGIDTTDDNLRIRYIDEALLGLPDAMKSGVPVLGYFHWSLLDNFEWIQGYAAHYGLASVDPKTFARSPSFAPSESSRLTRLPVAL